MENPNLPQPQPSESNSSTNRAIESCSTSHPELKNPELDDGVFLRADPLPRGAVMIGAHLAVQHAVYVRALAELDFIVRLGRYGSIERRGVFPRGEKRGEGVMHAMLSKAANTNNKKKRAPVMCTI